VPGSGTGVPPSRFAGCPRAGIAPGHGHGPSPGRARPVARTPAPSSGLDRRPQAGRGLEAVTAGGPGGGVAAIAGPDGPGGHGLPRLEPDLPSPCPTRWRCGGPPDGRVGAPDRPQPALRLRQRVERVWPAPPAPGAGCPTASGSGSWMGAEGSSRGRQGLTGRGSAPAAPARAAPSAGRALAPRLRRASGRRRSATVPLRGRVVDGGDASAGRAGLGRRAAARRTRRQVTLRPGTSVPDRPPPGARCGRRPGAHGQKPWSESDRDEIIGRRGWATP
jgi:hypothetical protein